MSTPGEPQQLPVFDPGNPFLTGCPANLIAAPVPTPEGQRLALTIRTTSATVTVFLSRESASQWAAYINAQAAGMSGLIVPG